MIEMVDMKETGIRDVVLDEIKNYAKEFDIKKVILFGSRARGDYKEKSDIDLAVSGENISAFSIMVDENTSTLLKFDIVNLDSSVQQELLQSIDGDGIIIYEKI